MGNQWYRASEVSGNFWPVYGYSHNGKNRRIKYGQNLAYSAWIFVDLLLTEIRLQEQVQAGEYLLSKSAVIQYEDSNPGTFNIKMDLNIEPPQYNEKI